MADNVVIKVGEQQWVRGEDGFDPVVTIEDIEHGHRVTITDREHPIEGQSFDVMDGASAYEQAAAGGYTGTEAEFNEELRSFKTLSEQAAGSAAAAAQSESNAAGSATTATTKAQEAADSAATALTRMNSANSSAQAAANSATSANSSANAASASAGAASDSASSASTSAQNAAASATAAAGSASTASTAATTAQGHASNAASSATAAAGSASAASTSASNAAASATAAGNAQTAAEAAQAAAAEVAPFYAEYGVTTKEEIAAAVNNKRQIFVRFNNEVTPIIPYFGTIGYVDDHGQGIGYRFLGTDGALQHVVELKSSWSHYYNNLNEPAQRAETAAAAAEEAAQSVDADRINERLDDLEQATTATTLGPASIATFDASAADMPLKGLTVDIEPVQDLHGYDHPWPAGGGKNLWPVAQLTQQTNNGIACNIPAGDYVLSFDQNRAGLDLSIRFFYVEGDTSQSVVKPSGTPTFHLDQPAVSANVTVANFQSGDVISNIQIEAGSTATDYEPYSNICPITGWTGCNVVRSGKNLIDDTRTIAGYLTSIGYVGGETDPTNRHTEKHNIKGGVEYHLRFDTSYTVLIRACIYRKNGTWLTTIDIPANTDHLTFVAPPESDTISVTLRGNQQHCWLTLEDTPDYTPYNGGSYPITFPTEAGTVYGGTLDVVTGELTVTWALIMASNIAWAQGVSSTEYRRVFNDAITGGKAKKLGLNNILSNKYGPHTPSAVSFSIRGNETTQLVTIRDDNFVSDLAGFEASLTGVQIAYELATPITYQLTPQEITTLLGTNNIWADCGDVTVTYGAYLETVKAHAERLGDSILSAIAPLETSYVATRDYAIGSYLFVGTKFYKVTAAIGSGDTINPGTNVTQTTVAAQLMEFNTLRISSESGSIATNAGEYAFFTVNAVGGTAPYTYKWSVSTDGGDTWRNTTANGYDTNTLYFKVASSYNGFMYRCNITDGNGNVITSTPVTLTIVS